ncbi:MAG TPA: SPOR domain-containing protein [Mucilaginibacter sp.]|nr:SPOR domain-containing protein [Mucilaginibacter sp.]
MNKAASVYKAFLQITGCCFFIALFSPVSAHAQTRGRVEVIKDPRIDTLAARRVELNKATGVDATTANGFRVQIFTGPNRKEAYDTQSKFHEAFPDTRTYIIYSEPNFKVRAGDFRTRLEAEQMQEELKKWFTGMFIISEKINLPKLDSTDE